MMQVSKGANVAVVINRVWANLHGVRMFLRRGENPQKEIRGVDGSHVIFAKVIDAEDSRGIWIELPSDKPKDNAPAEALSLLIPWPQVLTLVLADEFSQAIRDEARRIGFTGETEIG